MLMIWSGTNTHAGVDVELKIKVLLDAGARLDIKVLDARAGMVIVRDKSTNIRGHVCAFVRAQRSLLLPPSPNRSDLTLRQARTGIVADLYDVTVLSHLIPNYNTPSRFYMRTTTAPIH